VAVGEFGLRYVVVMSRGTSRGRRLVAPLALLALASCSSGTDDAVSPSPDALTRISDIAYDAATAAGDGPQGGGGGSGGDASTVRLGGFTGGATYGAYTVCTGGGSIGMNLAGTDVLLDCDGQAHRIQALVLEYDTATFTVTRPSDDPSEWAVVLTSK
jgi:hypothetical protein